MIEITHSFFQIELSFLLSKVTACVAVSLSPGAKWTTNKLSRFVCYHQTDGESKEKNKKNQSTRLMITGSDQGHRTHNFGDTKKLK